MTLLKNGSEIKHGGAPGAFETEFVYMENVLEEVRRIIAGSNISLEGLENLMEKLQQLRYVGYTVLYSQSDETYMYTLHSRQWFNPLIPRWVMYYEIRRVRLGEFAGCLYHINFGANALRKREVLGKLGEEKLIILILHF